MPNALSSNGANDIISVASQENIEFQRQFMTSGMSNPEKNPTNNLRFAPEFG